MRCRCHAEAQLLTSVEDVRDAKDDGEVTVADSGSVINAPLLSWPGGQRLNRLDLLPAGSVMVGGEQPSGREESMVSEEPFHVGHIDCGGCERTIRTLFGDVDGVEHVQADHRTNTVAVRYDAARIGRDRIVAELAEVGYAPKEA